MTVRDDIEQLHGLVQRCLRRDGPYPLSSGRVSNYYYDGKEGTLHPPTAWLIGNVLVDVILDSGAEAVGGLEIGAIPIADAIGIAAYLRGAFLPTFIVRKEAKAHGTRSQMSQSRLDDGTELLVAGRRVAIVDDVITTGKSIEHAVEAVQELGCIVALAVALVERHESEGALRGRGYPVFRIYFTDESGNLFIDEEFVRRAESAAQARLLPR